MPAADNPDVNITAGGDDDTTHVATINGTGEPAHTVDGTIGTIGTIINDDGAWDTVFEDGTFPEDGTQDAVVTVTHPDGQTTTLDGPTDQIDTTPPALTLTDPGIINRDDMGAA